MTPLEIDILFHYYTRAVDYREGDFSAPAVRSTIDAFRDDLSLLECWPDGAMPDGFCTTYRLTERGRVFIEALQALPLPVQSWAMPEPGDDRVDLDRPPTINIRQHAHLDSVTDPDFTGGVPASQYLKVLRGDE